jgi:hypothetical protein
MSEPYRFVGPQGTSRKFGPNKGVMREYLVLKRKEAKERQKRYSEQRNVLHQVQEMDSVLSDNTLQVRNLAA